MAETTQTQARRRGVNWIGLLFSLIFLSVASAGFTGDPWLLQNESTKWVVAGLVAAVGIGRLDTALPGRGPRN
jgi:hypothetical protein